MWTLDWWIGWLSNFAVPPTQCCAAVTKRWKWLVCFWFPIFLEFASFRDYRFFQTYSITIWQSIPNTKIASQRLLQYLSQNSDNTTSSSRRTASSNRLYVLWTYPFCWKTVCFRCVWYTVGRALVESGNYGWIHKYYWPETIIFRWIFLQEPRKSS
jgi:hypothetical protein